MRIEEIAMSELLPQRPPFQMVHRLTKFEEPVTETEFSVTEDCLFVENGEMLAAGLIENMAQSSAARIGYISKFILHCPVKIGFIGSVKGCKIHRCPKVGETLRTVVTLVQEIFGISLVNVDVYVGEEKIVEASMKTATKED